MKNKRKYLLLLLYRSLLIYLPKSSSRYGGEVSRKLRYYVCKHIFKKCGLNVNIERGARFGNGLEIEIGNNSGIGRYARIPNNLKIGDNVMMAPNVLIHSSNHAFERIDIPMCVQGVSEVKRTIIEDDIWIGSNVILTPGRIIRNGSIIAVGCVLTKDFPEFSIVGGNPSKLIRSRIQNG